MTFSCQVFGLENLKRTNEFCECPPISAPVCQNGQKVYPNACLAQCYTTQIFPLCNPNNLDCGCSNTGPQVCYQGKTWKNYCQAVCEGEARASTYECNPSPPSPPSCFCFDSPDDVVVCKGNRYWTNDCHARCDGVSDASADQCNFPPQHCSCGYDGPVVCKGSLRFANLCAAKEAGHPDATSAQCKTCSCSSTSSPVCFGKLKFKNKCQAECNGVYGTYKCPAIVPNPILNVIDFQKREEELLDKIARRMVAEMKRRELEKLAKRLEEMV